jgi:hypothetical protein
VSRRVYYWNPKRKQIQDDALANMRRARGAIDPALLLVAKEAIADHFAKAHDAEKLDKYQALDADQVAVDREKNLSVIKQFLEMKKDDPVMLGRIKVLVADL